MQPKEGEMLSFCAEQNQFIAEVLSAIMKLDDKDCESVLRLLEGKYGP